MRCIILPMAIVVLLTALLTGCSGNKPETKLDSDQQHIKNVAETRSAVLQKIYLKHYNYKPQSGTLKIKIFINRDGMVQNADLEVDKGSFTPEFMADIKSNLLTWKFVINEPTVYTFKTTFSKK